jgi:hypothetical protein
MVWPAVAAVLGGAALSGGGQIIGQNMQTKADKAAAHNQAQLQREFAQHGIRWKVADAKAAGLHPLAALGANTISYKPQQTFTQGNGVGKAMQTMGQGIQRAALQYQAARDRQMGEIEIRNAKLQNLKLEKEIELMGQNPGGHRDPQNPTTNPPFVGDPPVNWTPISPEKNIQKQSGIEAGSEAAEKMITHADGGHSLVMTEQLGESMEADTVSNWVHQIGKMYSYVEHNVAAFLSKWNKLHPAIRHEYEQKWPKHQNIRMEYRLNPLNNRFYSYPKEGKLFTYGKQFMPYEVKKKLWPKKVKPNKQRAYPVQGSGSAHRS